MNSRTVDLIYLDPPFNSKRQYKAPIGTKAEGQKFDDTWRWNDLDDRWLGEIDRRNPALNTIIHAARQIQGEGTAAYLTMMGIRLLELHRVLKDTGSIYLHCDPTAGHYLKASMDAVFGKDNFRNEIVWKRKLGEKHNLASKKMPAAHDLIYFYCLGSGKEAVWNQPVIPYSEEYIRNSYQYEDARGRYSTFPCTNETGGNKPYSFRGITRAWRFSKERMEQMYKDGLLVQATPTSPFRYKKYLEDGAGVKMDDCWLDIPQVRGSKERTGWATQKPLALLRRIIRASSNPGDVMLDPFAGCATACVAAEMERRQWVGIEACENANEIIQLRLDEAALGSLGTQADISHKVTIERNIPKRTDAEGIAEAKERKTPAYKKKENFDFLYGAQRGHCKGCHGHYKSKELTFDHKIPREKGGSDELDNLQLLCAHCNSTKGTGTMEDLRVRLQKQEEEMLAGWNA